jgi:hypothetical protein
MTTTSVPVVAVSYRVVQSGDIEMIEVRLLGVRSSRIGSVRRLTAVNWIAYAPPREARFGNVRAGFANRTAAAAWLVVKARGVPK